MEFASGSQLVAVGAKAFEKTGLRAESVEFPEDAEVAEDVFAGC